MKKTSYLFAALLLGNLTFANTSTSNYNQFLKIDPKADLLFAQDAVAGKIEVKDVTRHCYKLTLQNISPITMYFSDRPLRIAGNMHTQDFIAQWQMGNNNFAADAPNAVLGYTINHNKLRTLAVVKLTQPSYNRETNTLTYTIYPEGNTKLTELDLIKPTIYIDSTH